MAPSTIEGAIPSAIRQRIAEWAQTEGDAGNVVTMEWAGFLPAPAWENRRRAKVEITIGQGTPLTTVGYDAGMDQMGQVHRFTGEAVVTLRQPAGDGDGALLEAAGRLAAYFRGWHNDSPRIEITGTAAPTSTTATAPWMECALRVQFEGLATFGMVAS